MLRVGTRLYIKKHLKLPVTLITSETDINKDVFDNIIKIDNPNTNQTRNMHDGDIRKNVLWSNHTRSTVFDLSPYEETIVMDTDYMVENDTLLKAFETKEDFLINYDAQHIDFESTMTNEMKYISDTGIKMCWATVFYFKKVDLSQLNDLKECLNWSLLSPKTSIIKVSVDSVYEIYQRRLIFNSIYGNTLNQE